ncbi:hypothetical protein DMH27_02185 [Raoultella planticola]|nr:hypothetical protein [Raoultella planticola]
MLKYFTVDQVVEALKTGSATLYQRLDKTNMLQHLAAIQHAGAFKTALEIFDQWKKENKS